MVVMTGDNDTQEIVPVVVTDFCQICQNVVDLDLHKSFKYIIYIYHCCYGVCCTLNSGNDSELAST